MIKKGGQKQQNMNTYPKQKKENDKNPIQ